MPDLPGGVVARPRLFRLLSDALACPIVTVTGPAGWGKTQLLASWVRSPHCPLKAAWLSVERSDGDPRVFWPAVMAAVSRSRQDPRDAPQPVDSVSPVLEALLSVEQPLLLILDDVHLVEGSAVESELARLVRMLPPRVRVVLSGQYLPTLPLAKLRVERRVFSITGKDLAFTTAESAAMLAESGVEVSEHVAETLRDRTEGWSAGLRLAALSLIDGLPPEELLNHFGGDHIEVADYLMSEVLSRLPVDVEDFLLRTSVCDRLTGELAAELTGRQDSAELLKWMARHNVFTTADGPRQTWFRYHAMLGELLRSRLDQLGAATVQRLHLTASSWFSAHRMPVEAFEQAVRAEHWTSAAAILKDAWLAMYLDGKLVQLRELIDRLPHAIAAESELDDVRSAVGLAVGDASVSPGEGELTGAGFDSYHAAAPLPPLHVEAAARESLDPIPLEEMAAASGRWHRPTLPKLVVDLERARLGGDLVAAVAAAQQLVRLADSGDLEHVVHASDVRALTLQQLGMTEYWAGRRADAEAHLREALAEAADNSRAYVQLGCLGQLVLVLTAQNRLTEAMKESEAALALVHEQGWEFTGAAAPLWYALGWATFVRGELDVAEQHLEGAAVAVRRQDAAISTTLLLARGMINQIRGRTRDALGLLEEACRVMSRLRARYVFGDYIIGEQARLRVAIGDISGARAILEHYPQDPAGPIHLSIAWAELLSGEKKTQEATGILELATRTGQGLVDQHTQALILLALLRDHAGDDKRAVDTIAEAVALAAPEQFVQPFLVFGRPIERLLRAASRLPGADHAFVERVLARAEVLWPVATPSGRTGRTEVLDQQLTARELQVLGSLDSLASLPEISASLFVSVNTLKAHLRSLYRKLGVGSRREAVTKARSLGII
ncbi:MAG: hypothetical protein ABS81_04230 [Pseudonocardia sp. SCN 72-86]|nr:MAG: hypothetical protein ABS81_04230 [Pseudonocardia sp. SCN 72-86]